MRRRSCSVRSTHRTERGVSLVELMVGMVLGLIVVGAAVNMYGGSTRAAAFSEGLQAMQENGRYGVDVLQRGLRMAGYAPGERLDALDIASADADTIIVRQRQAFDCNGQDTTPAGGIAVNTWRFEPEARRIICRGSSAAATDMPVIEDVDGFRTLYGIDEDADPDGVPDRYVPWSAGLDPRRIAAVRFALLVSSGSPIRSTAIEERHVLLDTELRHDDRLARHVFESTVILRNGPR